MTRYWLNVDIPSKNGRLHRDSWQWARQKHATAFKGEGELRSDGGWLEFGSVKAAEDYSYGRFGGQ